MRAQATDADDHGAETISAYGEIVEDRVQLAAGQGELLADPLVWRIRGSAPAQPAAALQLARGERMRIEWPIVTPPERRRARLLGRDGQPLAVPVALGERRKDGDAVVTMELAVASLGAADYVLEVEAVSGDRSERKLLAFA